MPRAPARSLPRVLALAAGQWQGMDDTPEPVAAEPTMVSMARNCYVAPLSAGGAYVGRPGTSLAGVQLGASNQRTAQFIGQFTTQAGTEYTVLVLYGEIYTYDWGANAWTRVVTTANLTTAGATLSNSVRVRGLVFANQLVLSDGINDPISWTGTSGAGGITVLSNADVLFGKPWVRASKLGGIKATERNTWIWSEEGLLNTGFEAGGYTNAWTVPNPGNERLVAGVATNSSITLFWETTASVILGASNDEWATGNTTPSVSSTLGTRSPDSVLALDEGVLFVDQDGRPHIIPAGASQPIPLYERCQQTLATVNRSGLANVISIEDRATQTVKIGYPTGSASLPNLWLVYTRDMGRLTFTGIETGYTASVAGMVKNSAGRWVWMHAGDADGYIYTHGTPEAGPWVDADTTTTTSITRTLTTAALGNDSVVEKLFDQISVQAYSATTQTLAVSYVTSRQESLPQTVTLMGYGAVFDAAIFDTDTFGGGSNDTRGRVGTIGRGRWIRVTIAQAAVNEQFGIQSVRVVAYDEGAEPAIP